MRDNVGDGWCEGVNQNGKSGLFPAAYVQLADTPAPPVAGNDTHSSELSERVESSSRLSVAQNVKNTTYAAKYGYWGSNIIKIV